MKKEGSEAFSKLPFQKLSDYRHAVLRTAISGGEDVTHPSTDVKSYAFPMSLSLIVPMCFISVKTGIPNY